jgi:hypothetical protein
MKIFPGAFNLRRDILLLLPEALKILHSPASCQDTGGGEMTKNQHNGNLQVFSLQKGSLFE